jgi:acyl carrier protein
MNVLESEVYEKLTAMFCDIFMREEIVLTPQTTAKDVPGWDSFKQIEIMIATEEMFDIKININELENLGNVGDLAAMILAKTPAAGGN